MDIDLDRIRLAVEVHGEGRPVILLHGFPDSGALWRHQVPMLTAQGFKAPPTASSTLPTREKTPQADRHFVDTRNIFTKGQYCGPPSR